MSAPAALAALNEACWHALGEDGQIAHLAGLDLAGVRAQACVLAAANNTTVRRVLTAWVALGVLDAQRLGPALAAR